MRTILFFYLVALDGLYCFYNIYLVTWSISQIPVSVRWTTQCTMGQEYYSFSEVPAQNQYVWSVSWGHCGLRATGAQGWWKSCAWSFGKVYYILHPGAEMLMYPSTVLPYNRRSLFLMNTTFQELSLVTSKNLVLFKVFWYKYCQSAGKEKDLRLHHWQPLK